VTIYEDGFWDGVQYYNTQNHKNVKVLGWDEQTQKGSFIGNFTDAGAGQSLTNTFIGEGADVTADAAVAAYLPYVRAELAKGTHLAAMTRHAAGFHVMPGATIITRCFA